MLIEQIIEYKLRGPPGPTVRTYASRLVIFATT